MSEITGRAKGGKAAAEKMTAEERKAKSVAMVEAKRAKKDTPAVTHRGVIKVGDLELPCYVLSDARRVLSGRGLQESLKLVDAVLDGQTSGSRMARLLANKSLNPFIDGHLSAGHFDPIVCFDGDTKIKNSFLI